MQRRSLSLAPIVLVPLLAALLGIATNYLTEDTKNPPAVLVLAQRWSPELVLVVVALLVVAGIWQWVAERPTTRKPTWNSARPPYPGLEAFTAEDAGVFFGRENEARQLVERLQPALPARAHRFVTVVGPSGSGKSSLIRAGLVAELHRKRHRWVMSEPVLPGTEPVRALAEGLTSLLPAMSSEQWVARLTEGPETLGRLVEQIQLHNGGRSTSVLIFIDQLEELVTLCGPRARDDLLVRIHLAIADVPQLWVVASLRSEFLTELLTSSHADLFQDPVVLGLLGKDALRRVIVGPAEAAGLTFVPPSLVDTMIEDAGGSDALPLLAYTLQELYLRVGKENVLREADYREMGGVEGALSKQANKVEGELRSAGDGPAVIPTLLKLVTFDGAEPTRRRVRRNAFDAQQQRVADAFVSARLLTSDAESGDGTVTVAHEALFRVWAPLKDAVHEEEDTLRLRNDLEQRAMDWDRSGRPEEDLLRGERLRTARGWASGEQRLAGELPVLADFVEASVQADTAALGALSETTAARALANVDRDPDLSLLLAIAAVEDCIPTPAARRTLLTLLAHPGLRVLRGHQDAVQGVSWSPDRGRIATASDDRTVRIWDAELGSELLTLRGHRDAVWAVAWSPDGARIATASRDRTGRIWDSRHGTELVVLNGHEEWAGSVAWSPDGHRVVTTSRDRTGRVWDATNGRELIVLRGHRDAIWGVDWSPDGDFVATASDDGTTRVWAADSGEFRFEVRGHEEPVWDVSWAPDGRRIATASRDRTARITDVGDGRTLAVMRGHGDMVRSVQWSSDGLRVATASHDRTARIWDSQDGTELMILRGHEEPVRGVTWSTDGRRLVTVSHDRTARMWDSEHGIEVVALRGHKDWVNDVAWSPDGNRLATASHDRTARIWTGSGTEALVLRGHTEVVRAVAWAPSGDLLATTSHDRTARIWRAGDGDLRAVLNGHEDAVVDVAWSPDGSRVVTASHDRLARIWSVDGQLLHVLDGHDDWIGGVGWSPDGSRLATVSNDRTVRIWDGAGVHVGTLSGHTDWVGALEWSPDSRRLATSSGDCTVRLWDADRREIVAVLAGHESATWAVSWSPDGKRVVTASRDRTARIWDADPGKEVSVLCVHDDGVAAVDWSPDGRRIATASRDRTGRVWNAWASIEVVVAKARERLHRELTQEERQRFTLPLRSRTAQ